ISMTPEQIVRALRIVRYSPEAARIGRRLPGIRTIASQAGLSYRTLYRITMSGQCSPAQAWALTGAFAALAAVTNGRNQDPRSLGNSLEDFLSQYEPQPTPQPVVRRPAAPDQTNSPAGRTITLKIRWPFER